jgi:hypothetical protein
MVTLELLAIELTQSSSSSCLVSSTNRVADPKPKKRAATSLRTATRPIESILVHTMADGSSVRARIENADNRFSIFSSDCCGDSGIRTPKGPGRAPPFSIHARSVCRICSVRIEA